MSLTPLLQLNHTSCSSIVYVPQNFHRKELKCPHCHLTLRSTNTTNATPIHPPITTDVKGASLVIRPTFTNWLQSNRNSLLHIGISNATGSVVSHFDSSVHQNDWRGSLTLSIPLMHLPHEEESALQRWDDALLANTLQEREREILYPYHTHNNNCYDFVVRFLNAICFQNHTNHTKLPLVENYISLPVSNVELFIKWYSSALHATLTPCPTLTQSPTYTCDICTSHFTKEDERFHCLVCYDFDLCCVCYHTHHHSHQMVDNKGQIWCD
jgi:hypothetical protein